MPFLASDADVETFARDGFLLVPGLLDAAETERLAVTARRDRSMEQGATTRSDAAGGKTILAVRDSLSDDIYSRLVRSRRIAESMSRLLGDEVYHYHHKLMLKEPRVGGAWEWHQDYGYWYSYGCLYPAMGSCYIAIDRATQANGCLQIVPGSHHFGRLEHGKVGGQTGADPERVAAVLNRLPLMYVEMQPGDGLFFHSNLLHRSDANTSPDPRWSLIACYNTRGNDPYELKRHNRYQPLDLLPDDAQL
ncbi:phytanoyl-CoA dioxygenase family protein [Candidatus Laterigemmans baculatus]|uniref:phytanoyl-CoA dioxygenase family protein n=1 Tax=Candidatus Laterigemmans baculatus TaxID=2770505 RepID=UPI0013D959CA|nr:phytanoyl-CoA dioxygenase family protein [Candidatus Laterigemmans baculatus]